MPIRLYNSDYKGPHSILNMILILTIWHDIVKNRKPVMEVEFLPFFSGPRRNFCICTVQFSVLLNCEPSCFFANSGRLRQGDPLSLSIYLGDGALSRMILRETKAFQIGNSQSQSSHIANSQSRIYWFLIFSLLMTRSFFWLGSLLPPIFLPRVPLASNFKSKVGAYCWNVA